MTEKINYELFRYKQYGNWTILDVYKTPYTFHMMCDVVCKCGNSKRTRLTTIVNGMTQKCVKCPKGITKVHGDCPSRQECGHGPWCHVIGPCNMFLSKNKLSEAIASLNQVLHKDLVMDINFRIQETAYYLWLNSGKPEGKDLEFWLQAEREVK